jgi:hypothetical protein
VATATVAEEGYGGTVSFVDFLSLCHIEGVWKIVNMTFAHVGGEPPTWTPRRPHRAPSTGGAGDSA